VRIEGLRVGWGNGWFGNSKIELKLGWCRCTLRGYLLFTWD
jgi:hypothetical protein